MTSDEFDRPSMINAIRELLSKKYFILLVLYFTLPAIAGWVVKDWMPDILKEKFNSARVKPVFRLRSTSRWLPSSGSCLADG